MSRLMPVFAVALLFAAPIVARAGDDEKPVQDADVPKAAVDALQKKYAGAKVSAWVKEEEDKVTTYEAKFEVTTKDKDGKESTRKLEAILTAEGKILEEEETIAAAALPDAVKKGLADSKYAKAEVKHAVKLVKDEKADDPAYELSVVLDSKKVDLTLDKAGKILEEEGDEADEKAPEPAMK